MLETLAILIALVSQIFEGESINALRLMVQVLLWAQIGTGIILLGVKGLYWALASLGGAVEGANTSGEIEVSEGVGAILGLGLVGMMGLWNIFLFLVRKSLLIAGCLMILASPNMATTVGGLMYGFALFWSWRNDWALAKAFFAGAKQGLES